VHLKCISGFENKVPLTTEFKNLSNQNHSSSLFFKFISQLELIAHCILTKKQNKTKQKTDQEQVSGDCPELNFFIFSQQFSHKAEILSKHCNHIRGRLKTHKIMVALIISFVFFSYKTIISLGD